MIEQLITRSDFAKCFELIRVNSKIIHPRIYRSDPNLVINGLADVRVFDISCLMMHNEQNGFVDRVIYTELCKYVAQWKCDKFDNLLDVITCAIESGFAFDNTVLIELDCKFITVYCPKHISLNNDVGFLTSNGVNVSLYTHPWEFIIVVLGNKKVGNIFVNDTHYGVNINPWDELNKNKSCYVYGFYT